MTGKKSSVNTRPHNRKRTRTHTTLTNTTTSTTRAAQQRQTGRVGARYFPDVLLPASAAGDGPTGGGLGLAPSAASAAGDLLTGGGGGARTGTNAGVAPKASVPHASANSAAVAAAAAGSELEPNASPKALPKSTCPHPAQRTQS